MAAMTARRSSIQRGKGLFRPCRVKASTGYNLDPSTIDPTGLAAPGKPDVQPSSWPCAETWAAGAVIHNAKPITFVTVAPAIAGIHSRSLRQSIDLSIISSWAGADNDTSSISDFCKIALFAQNASRRRACTVPDRDRHRRGRRQKQQGSGEHHAPPEARIAGLYRNAITLRLVVPL